MKYINRKITLAFSLLLLLSQTKIANAENEAIVIAGVAAGAGLVAYAYNAYYDSISYHKSVIDETHKLYYKAQNYIAHVAILEKKFNLIGMTESDKRIATGRITEDLAFELTLPINHFGINNYLKDLSNIIEDLKNQKKSLKRTIGKLKVKADVGSVYNSGCILIDGIDELMPRLEFLKLYIDRHKSYFTLCEVGNRISKEFERDFQILVSNIEPFVIEDLKKHIRIKYFEKNVTYPYLKYIESLSNCIKEIDNALSQLSFRYPILIASAEKLKNDLSTIRTFIVADREYLAEKDKFKVDKEKQEKDRIEQELKKKELELKKQEAESREREVAAREKAVKIKEQEAQLKLLKIVTKPQVQSSPTPIHVHINNN